MPSRACVCRCVRVGRLSRACGSACGCAPPRGTSGSPGWLKSGKFCRFRGVSDLRTSQRRVRPLCSLAENETRVLQRLTSATERTKKCVTTRTRPAVAGTTSAAEPTVAADPCTQIINARSYGGADDVAALGGHRGVVRARLSPPNLPSHPFTASSDVRRRYDGVARLQLLWSSCGHHRSPPRAAGQSRNAIAAMFGPWQLLSRRADAVLS